MLPDNSGNLGARAFICTAVGSTISNKASFSQKIADLPGAV
jgi:hypothetical protein